MSDKVPHPSDHDRIVHGPVSDYVVAASIFPDPKYLYTHEAVREQAFLLQNAPYILGIISGFGMVCFKNWATRKPIYAGIQRIPIWCTFSTIIFWGVREVTRKYNRFRDRVYRHYIALHPEDFPPPPKIKNSEKWEDWLPNRWRLGD